MAKLLRKFCKNEGRSRDLSAFRGRIAANTAYISLLCLQLTAIPQLGALFSFSAAQFPIPRQKLLNWVGYFDPSLLYSHIGAKGRGKDPFSRLASTYPQAEPYKSPFCLLFS